MLLAPFLSELLAEQLISGVAPAMLRPFQPDRFAPTDAAESSEADYYARYGLSPGSSAASPGGSASSGDPSSSGKMTSNSSP